jgi:putative endonuclease
MRRTNLAEARTYWIYILASRRNGTLYIGVTNDLLRRAQEHREGRVLGFTKKYNVKHLVYFEEFTDVHAAIHRETRLKKWNRKWKLDLIEAQNREWKDLYEELTAATVVARLARDRKRESCGESLAR